MSFIDLLSIYGPGLASQGQPINGSSALPLGGQQAPPATAVDPNDPAEKMGGRGGGFDWKSLLAGGLGAIGSGLLGGKEGAASFGANFAQAKHQQNLQRRDEEHATQKAIADQAHKAWQDIQGMDFSVLPPELAHLQGKSQELNQRYVQAITKDSPGGVTISPKEAQEIIALSSVLRGVKEKVGAFQKSETAANEAARPYSSGLMAGTLEPPPSIEGYLDAGLTEQEAAARGGRELFDKHQLARLDYETPQFDERTGGLITPRESVTLRGQELASKRAEAQQAAVEANRLRIDADRDRAFQAQQSHWNRMDQRRAEEDSRRQDRYNNLPQNYVTEDADGNRVTRVLRRGDLVDSLQGGEGDVSFRAPIPNSERLKAKEARVALQQLDELGLLYKPEFVGPVAGRAYAAAEKFPDLGQLDAARSSFVAQNSAIKNATIKLITGAQMSASEAERILLQVPDVVNPPKVWEARYAQTKKNTAILEAVISGQLSHEAAFKALGLTTMPVAWRKKPGLTAPPTMPDAATGNAPQSPLDAFRKKHGIGQ